LWQTSLLPKPTEYQSFSSKILEARSISLKSSLTSVGWKKMITKLHKEGKKAQKGKKESTSNF